MIEVIPHPNDAPLDSIWVDDCKVAPKGCAVARTYDDALRLLRRFKYRTLYLDHDLGERRTGLDLLRQLRSERRLPDNIVCISWNPAGRDAIVAEIQDIERGGV